MTPPAAAAAPVRAAVLYLAFELGWGEWKLAFSTGPRANVRLRAIGGRNTGALLEEIAKAKKRLGLPDKGKGDASIYLERLINRCVPLCAVKGANLQWVKFPPGSFRSSR
jgi:hypothetical protein